jgi:phosphoribosyl 1,2-cyclic phosphodiesterase
VGSATPGDKMKPKNRHRDSESDVRPCVCVLASGSKGNAVYVSDGDTAVLFDAGLSGREIQKRMKQRGLDPQTLNAIIVSHEHADHIQGVGVLSRRFHLPVYISPRTHTAAPSLGTLHGLQHFECGRPFQIRRMKIRPFALSHDAKDPAGFTIGMDGLKIGIATDLGIATTMVKTHLQDCTLLILEANHDLDMLLNGPYPWPLKQRIKSRTGHLSNAETGCLLQELAHQRLKHIVLAHLSETNNSPEKARRTIAEALPQMAERLTVTCQHESGNLLFLDDGAADLTPR